MTNYWLVVTDPENFEKIENTMFFLKEEMSKIDVYVKKIKGRIESRKM